MTKPLPQALAAYYAAKNNHDIDAMLAPFSETASVRDEGKTMRGLPEIRAWMEETTRKYGVTVEVKAVEQDGEIYTVAALVSGRFPGSPATLHYRFTLAGGHIAHLEIG